MRWTCVEGVARGHNLVVGLIFAETVHRNTIPMKDLNTSSVRIMNCCQEVCLQIVAKENTHVRIVCPRSRPMLTISRPPEQKQRQKIPGEKNTKKDRTRHRSSSGCRDSGRSHHGARPPHRSASGNGPQAGRLEDIIS